MGDEAMNDTQLPALAAILASPCSPEVEPAASVAFTGIFGLLMMMRNAMARRAATQALLDGGLVAHAARWLAYLSPSSLVPLATAIGAASSSRPPGSDVHAFRVVPMVFLVLTFEVPSAGDSFAPALEPYGITVRSALDALGLDDDDRVPRAGEPFPDDVPGFWGLVCGSILAHTSSARAELLAEPRFLRRILLVGAAADALPGDVDPSLNKPATGWIYALSNLLGACSLEQAAAVAAEGAAVLPHLPGGVA